MGGIGWKKNNKLGGSLAFASIRRRRRRVRKEGVELETLFCGERKFDQNSANSHTNKTNTAEDVHYIFIYCIGYSGGDFFWIDWREGPLTRE